MNVPSIETTIYSLDRDPPTEPPQRRTSERELSLFRVGAVTVGTRRELCLIKNISAGGMLIRAYFEIPVGSRLSVELKQGELVAGSVKWAKEGSVGVSFDSPIDVVALLSSATIEQQPRMPRIEVRSTATIREGAAVRRAQLVNVSQGGICVTTAEQLTVGAAVVATLNGLSPEPAVVRWKEDDCYGIAFNRVLSMAQLVTWLQQQSAR